MGAIQSGRYVVGIMKRLFLIPVLMLALAACGGNEPHIQPAATSPTTSTTSISVGTTVSPIDYGARYLQLIGPVNDEADKLNKIFNNSAGKTGTQLATAAEPFGQALETFDQAALRVTWPGAAMADVRAMVTADGATKGDLRSLSGQTGSSISNWSTQFASDVAKSEAAASIIRADLGLDPPK